MTRAPDAVRRGRVARATRRGLTIAGLALVVVLAVGFGWRAAGADGEATGAAAFAADDLAADDGAAREAFFCANRLRGELWSRTELYFGLSRPDGSEISDLEFESFLDAEITPRFPDGLTLLDANGQYRTAAGLITKERSKLLILFYPFEGRRHRAIETIRSLYESRFEQEAVLRVDETSCVSF